MLARQNKNTKIIEIDQATGLPLSECQDLADDFSLTLKNKEINPDQILNMKSKIQDKPKQENIAAIKQPKQGRSQVGRREAIQHTAPKPKINRDLSDPRRPAQSRIGGGIGSGIKPPGSFNKTIHENMSKPLASQSLNVKKVIQN